MVGFCPSPRVVLHHQNAGDLLMWVCNPWPVFALSEQWDLSL